MAERRLPRARARLGPPNPLLLAYHKISFVPEFGVNVVSPRRFGGHLASLRQYGFDPITLADLRAGLQKTAPLPPRAVHLTFDDGYANFAAHAWPRCRREGFSATVFVVTDYVGRRSRWDRSSPCHRHLDWRTLRDLVEEGVTVGAHTATHPFLTRLDRKAAFEELRRSKATLEDGLGIQVTALAYPYGDYSPEVAALAVEVGFELAFTMEPEGSIAPENRMTLPRVAVYAFDTQRRFAAKLGVRGERAWRRARRLNRWIHRCAYGNLLLPR